MKKGLTGRIPDGTITINEWKTKWLVSSDAAFGTEALTQSFAAFREKKKERLAHFSAIKSTSAASLSLSFGGGGIDPGSNTPREDHSYSVNASASVPSSQLYTVRHLIAVVEIRLERMEGKILGRRRTCE